MNDYTQLSSKIEDVLKNNLPELISAEWKKDIFGSLPVCVKDEHIKNLIDPCRHLLLLGGKRWRPLLLVLASGLKSTDGTPQEIAFQLTPLVELVHTASLIHDDIEDNADMRRGEPAAHINYGLDTAINAGSWLYFAAFSCIDKACDTNARSKAASDETTTILKLRLHNLLETELRRLHLGQAMDIAWHKDNNSLPTDEEYMAMVRMKTGTLASLAAKSGMLAAGGTIEEAEILGKIAADIGVAFQIHDDIINLTTGNKGKKRGDDIVEGKKSMPILLHLKENPNDFDQIMAYFQQAANEGIDSLSIEKCITLINKGNALQKATEISDKLKSNAMDSILSTWKNSAAASSICNLFNKL